MPDLRIEWDIRAYVDKERAPSVDLQFKGPPEMAPAWFDAAMRFLESLKEGKADAQP